MLTQYTYHHSEHELEAQTTIPMYNRYLLSKEWDGDVVILRIQTGDTEVNTHWISFARTPGWFFADGHLAVLTGPRGDETADRLITQLLKCI